MALTRASSRSGTTRNPVHPAAAWQAALGAGIVRADFEDVDSLAAAAQGMDAVFASGSAHRVGPGGEERHGRNLMAALSAVGVPHLVFVSGAGADGPTGVAVLDAKRAVEQRVAELRLPATVIAPVYLMENLFNPWNLAAIRAGALPTPVPPARRLQQAAISDILALSVLAIEHPGVFTGERIEVASAAPTGEEAAATLSALVGRGFAARQFAAADLPPGLAALFGWLDDNPSPVDIGALRRCFPAIAWHSFADWAKDHQARLAEAISPNAGQRSATGCSERRAWRSSRRTGNEAFGSYRC
jgi:uncharacterized protein YbjT (DUF2867 family)